MKKGFHFSDRYLINITGTLNNAFNHPVYFAANSTANDPLTTGVAASASNGVKIGTANEVGFENITFSNSVIYNNGGAYKTASFQV